MSHFYVFDVKLSYNSEFVYYTNQTETLCGSAVSSSWMKQ